MDIIIILITVGYMAASQGIVRIDWCRNIANGRCTDIVIELPMSPHVE